MSITGGIYPNHLKYNVVTPILNYLNLGGNRAVNMVTGTIFAESYVGNYTYLKQQNNGPALGIGEMERFTHDDIWKNYLSAKNKKTYADLLKHIAGDFNTDNNGIPKADTLIGNLYYAVGMTRIFYLRKPQALPAYNDATAMANYYKVHYNTSKGKADVNTKIKYFQTAINT